jgi:hypothetical protein
VAIDETRGGDRGPDLLQGDPQSSKWAYKHARMQYCLFQVLPREHSTEHSSTGGKEGVQQDCTPRVGPCGCEMGEDNINSTAGRATPNGLPTIPLKVAQRFLGPRVRSRRKQGCGQAAGGKEVLPPTQPHGQRGCPEESVLRGGEAAVRHLNLHRPHGLHGAQVDEGSGHRGAR